MSNAFSLEQAELGNGPSITQGITVILTSLTVALFIFWVRRDAGAVEKALQADRSSAAQYSIFVRGFPDTVTNVSGFREVEAFFATNYGPVARVEVIERREEHLQARKRRLRWVRRMLFLRDHIEATYGPISTQESEQSAVTPASALDVESPLAVREHLIHEHMSDVAESGGAADQENAKKAQDEAVAEAEEDDAENNDVEARMPALLKVMRVLRRTAVVQAHARYIFIRTLQFCGFLRDRAYYMNQLEHACNMVAKTTAVAQQPIRGACCGVVTFVQRETAARVLHEHVYRNIRAWFGLPRFRGRFRLSVSPAPEPSDLIYKNLGTSGTVRILWQILTSLIGLTYMMGCVALLAIIYTAEFSTKKNSSLWSFSHWLVLTALMLAVAAINTSLVILLQWLVGFERHPTKSSLQLSILWKAVVIQVLNIFLSIEALAGSFRVSFSFIGFRQSIDIQWYDRVPALLASYVFADVLQTAVIALLQPYHRFFKWVVIKVNYIYSQKELDRRLAGPRFQLAYSTAHGVKLLAVALLYVSPVPGVVVMVAGGVLVMYWMEKYSLLRVCAHPAAFDARIARLTARMLWIVFALHLLASLFTYIFTGPQNKSMSDLVEHAVEASHWLVIGKHTQLNTTLAYDKLFAPGFYPVVLYSAAVVAVASVTAIIALVWMFSKQSWDMASWLCCIRTQYVRVPNADQELWEMDYDIAKRRFQFRDYEQPLRLSDNLENILDASYSIPVAEEEIVAVMNSTGQRRRDSLSTNYRSDFNNGPAGNEASRGQYSPPQLADAAGRNDASADAVPATDAAIESNADANPARADRSRSVVLRETQELLRQRQLLAEDDDTKSHTDVHNDSDSEGASVGELGPRMIELQPRASSVPALAVERKDNATDVLEQPLLADADRPAKKSSSRKRTLLHVGSILLSLVFMFITTLASNRLEVSQCLVSFACNSSARNISYKVPHVVVRGLAAAVFLTALSVSHGWWLQRSRFISLGAIFTHRSPFDITAEMQTKCRFAIPAAVSLALRIILWAVLWRTDLEASPVAKLRVGVPAVASQLLFTPLVAILFRFLRNQYAAIGEHRPATELATSKHTPADAEHSASNEPVLVADFVARGVIFVVILAVSLAAFSPDPNGVSLTRTGVIGVLYALASSALSISLRSTWAVSCGYFGMRPREASVYWLWMTWIVLLPLAYVSTARNIWFQRPVIAGFDAELWAWSFTVYILTYAMSVWFIMAIVDNSKGSGYVACWALFLQSVIAAASWNTGNASISQQDTKSMQDASIALITCAALLSVLLGCLTFVVGRRNRLLKLWERRFSSM